MNDPLEELVAACEEAFIGDLERPDGEEFRFDDDEDVSRPDTGITFGQIRRARAALTAKARSEQIANARIHEMEKSLQQIKDLEWSADMEETLPWVRLAAGGLYRSGASHAQAQKEEKYLYGTFLKRDGTRTDRYGPL